MSYKRIFGFASAENIRNRAMVWTFDSRIGKGGAKAFFDGVTAGLPQKQLIVRVAQIIEAKWVSALMQRKSRGEKELTDRGAIPADLTFVKRGDTGLKAT